MKLLPADRQSFVYENGAVIAGLHEHNGYRHYSLFLDRELLARGDHLQGAFVDEVDGTAPVLKL